jgi:lathosterol oxidase
MDPSTIDRIWRALHVVPYAAVERATSYAIAAGFTYVLLHILLARWLAKRRIAPQPPRISQMTWEVLYSLRSACVYGIVGGLMAFAVRSRWTKMYWRIEDYGAVWFYVSIAVTILIHDAYFYWTHRIMHHPWLFRFFHRTHHLSTNPSPWAAYAFSVPEAFVQAGIAPLVLFTIPLHPAAFGIFMTWQIAFNVMGHCGFEFYPKWFMRSGLGVILNTPTHHAQHHETNRANFSLYFNHWDRLMGTNHARYAERFAETTGQL